MHVHTTLKATSITEHDRHVTYFMVLYTPIFLDISLPHDSELTGHLEDD